jgi:phosphoglycolate phosphatase-like HAD superfamily hydrolase
MNSNGNDVVRFVTFDVDGVVLDSLHAIVDSVNESLLEFGGQPIKHDWYRKNNLGTHADFLRSRGIKEQDFQEFDRLFDKFLRRACLYGEMPGARDTLQLARTIGPVHLISACGAEVTTAKICHHNGLAELVDGVHGDEAKSKVFRNLMTEFELSSSEIVFVTDMPRDIHEAERAGLWKIIVLLSDFSTAEQFSGWDYPICENHEEVREALVRFAAK